jgi:hypothetical protein
MVLGLTRECVATLLTSNTFIDYQYMEYLLESNLKALNGDDDDEKLQYLLLGFLKFRLDQDGSNILHILATNEKFL